MSPVPAAFLAAPISPLPVVFARRLTALLTLLGVLATLAQGISACLIDHGTATAMLPGEHSEVAEMMQSSANNATPDEQLPAKDCDHPQEGAPKSEECESALHCHIVAVGAYATALTVAAPASAERLLLPHVAAPSPTSTPESPPPKG